LRGRDPRCSIKGFLVIERRHQRCAEITYAAVRPDLQRPGIGTSLLHAVFEQLQVDGIDPLPGWDPGNPSAIYVKALTST
jgi:ribosomal protein S18 acetylase RimI-like enzyme